MRRACPGALGARLTAVRVKAESVRAVPQAEQGAGPVAGLVPAGDVHLMDADDEPLCGATVTPLYLLEWEWNEFNDLMMCPECATLAESRL
jgi:hypothetical protein